MTKSKKVVRNCIIAFMLALSLVMICLYINCMIEATATRLYDVKGTWVCDEMTIDYNKKLPGYSAPLVTMTVDGNEYKFSIGLLGGGSATIYDESDNKVMSATNIVKGDTCYIKVNKDYYFNKFTGKTFVLKKQAAPQTQTE